MFIIFFSETTKTMETVFATPSKNVDVELFEAKTKIKTLENKIVALEMQVKEKVREIDAIEKNMTRQYVEDWSVTDSDGKKGAFCGNIYWIKGGGILYYNNKTHFEGDWGSTGEITNGILFDYYGDTIAEWEDGVEIEEEEEKEEEEGTMPSL